MASTHAHIAIVGAGPCGLACAHELRRLGHEDWTLFERADVAGGHAGSEVDPAGFTWDQGGHVVFSHFGEFDRLLEEALGDDVHEHERSSYVRLDGRWVPYPFQNNLRYLREEDAYDCLVGLIDAALNGAGADGGESFAAWMERTFGEGITRLFMRPYNLKVWATPAELMSSSWIAERVSVLDFRRALRSVLLGLDDVAWGPNNTFRFPRSGGTGEIYRRLAHRLGSRVRYEAELVGLDAERRRIRFSDGSSAEYDALVSTMPVDRLVAAIDDCPADVRAAAATLEHNAVWVVGVGCERGLSDDRSWLYFADESVPFYRVTNFAKYAAANVPGGDTARYSSYLTETAYSEHRPGNRAGLEQTVVDGLVATGLIDETVPIASLHVIDVEYAYPIPTLERDAALAVVQPWLMERDIYSRGRFGSWLYEIGNMDHAAKMGIDVARLLVEGRPEELWS
jgi:protoporphyrinogen oxidase